MEERVPIGRWLGMLHRFSRIHFAEALQPLGLAGPHISILKALYVSDGPSQDDLARELRIDKGTAARHLAKLEKAGYVSRSEDPRDRRVKRVHLTELARQVEPELSRTLQQWSAALTQGFTQEEREAARELLARMAANAEQAIRAPAA